MVFLELNYTLGQTQISHDELTWNSVNFASEWGLSYLDAMSLATLRKRLENNGESCTNNYLVAKLGFNFNNPAEFKQRITLMVDKDLVTTTKHHTGEYFC